MAQYDSPYTYVGNNPISFIDPSGMFASAIEKTVVDPGGNIIYHDPDDDDKNIYRSPDGKKGADGNTDGLEVIGKEKPDEDYSEGRVFMFTGDNDHKTYSSWSSYVQSQDKPLVVVSPEMEIIELVFTGGGMVLIKRGSKWIAKKATKKVVAEIAEEASETGSQIIVRNAVGAAARNGKNVKKLSQELIDNSLLDAHDFKKAYLGKKAKVSRWDIYKHTDNEELILLKKGGKGDPLFTGEFWSDYLK